MIYCYFLYWNQTNVRENKLTFRDTRFCSLPVEACQISGHLVEVEVSAAVALHVLRNNCIPLRLRMARCEVDKQSGLL
jgi:hypothetical protein